MRLLLILGSALILGCAASRPLLRSNSAPAPLPSGAPPNPAPPAIDEKQAAFWIWHDGEVWRVRTTAGARPHRFQGSVEGTSGGIVEVRTDDQALNDHVAQVGNTVQFDYDSGDQAPRGFDARITGGCLRFDLMLDGKRRPDRVHFGPAAEVPARLPVERCP